MANYKSAEKRASETVTFRLTQVERNLMSHLAELRRLTLTDLLRSLIQEEASKQGVKEVPLPTRRKRPGRPKKKKQIEVEEQVLLLPLEPVAESAEEKVDEVEPVQPAALLPEEPEAPKPVVEAKAPQTLPWAAPDKARTFGELLERFRTHFSTRAEGTRRELDETIRFLTQAHESLPPLFPLGLPLSGLTLEFLQGVRERIKDMDFRVAKKNLHLTYLRMMLHWAVKEPDIELDVNPATQLKSFTLKELEGEWPRY